ncbi:DUF2520 domain-containing protein [Pontibacter diazotrophicus]|uniref:DUF2520 domain-containing protein n=1 Tax=Pontibacter diazotrophicus TaxID=1400979 RepID=A0A3D8LE69_9BACT|nr:Rossmann-like and DUF2520 domain-containing protein [Pontibacter diazotrophicus]RDV15586.1 DUF2520 domain-containing protein [Pontibacter diazotrophicus]
MKLIQKKRIAFVGAGNVAWHLAQALAAAGHEIKAVYSRSRTSREALASKLPQAQPIATPDFKDLTLDVVFISVPDAALAEVAAALKVAPGTLVVHTSGSQPLTLLQSIEGARTGVFYPLQTFSKSKSLDLAQVPLLVEAWDEDTLQQIEALARSISSQVHTVSSEARKQLHLAAVFACNFTNHLLGISQQILQEANLPEQLLQPLIEETVAKAAQQNPFAVQTGPAIRGDENVLQAHLQLLQQHPGYALLYQQLSRSIQTQAPNGDAKANQG